MASFPFLCKMRNMFSFFTLVLWQIRDFCWEEGLQPNCPSHLTLIQSSHPLSSLHPGSESYGGRQIRPCSSELPHPSLATGIAATDHLPRTNQTPLKGTSPSTRSCLRHTRWTAHHKNLAAHCRMLFLPLLTWLTHHLRISAWLSFLLQSCPPALSLGPCPLQPSTTCSKDISLSRRNFLKCICVIFWLLQTSRRLVYFCSL